MNADLGADSGGNQLCGAVVMTKLPGGAVGFRKGISVAELVSLRLGKPTCDFRELQSWMTRSSFFLRG